MSAKKACKHCGEPLPKKEIGEFCCSGCEGAYAFIQNSGLGQYYTHQQFSENARSLVPEDAPDIKWFDAFVEQDEEHKLYTIHLMLEGIHCAACVWLIEQTLRRLNGVENVRLNMGTRRLTLSWSGEKSALDTYIKSMYMLGYKATPFDPLLLRSKQRKEEKQLLINMAVSGFAAGNLMAYSVSLWSGGDMSSATQALFTWIVALISLPTIFYAGRPFFSSALQALKHKRMNMDVPIALAISTATALSIFEMIQGRETYFDGCVTLVFFLTIGRYLDALMRGKSRRYAEDLLMVEQGMATRKKANGSVEVVPVKQLKEGDILLVGKGEKLGVDVRVLEGETYIDTSALTGETYPEKIKQGGIIGAGCVNLDAPMTCTVVARSEKSAMHRIVQLVEDAIDVKNKYTRWADVAARIYAPAVHILALLTFVVWMLVGGDLYVAVLTSITVLIVTCPCAFALAVPSAMAAANSKLMQKGILLKSSDVLEKTPNIKHIVFDKTGTLTEGELVPTGLSKDHLVLAASLASYSSHPLAKMLLKSAQGKELLALTHIQEHTGKGVEASFNGQVVKLGSAAFCGAEGTGMFLKTQTETIALNFKDTLKENVSEILKKLHKKGYTLHLLTGDAKELAEDVKNLPFNHIKTGATPEEKYAYLANLKHVMMIGDGLNDAAALAKADVAVSFGKATALAQNSADVILCHKTLNSLLNFIIIANKTKRTVVQNFGFSISYNFVAVPMAMMAMMTPMWAAIFMSASSLLVVGNALRLKKA